MEWIKIEDKTPHQNENVEFPADKERDGILQGIYSNGCFWSSHDGYHEPKIWKPYQPERSKREDSTNFTIRNIREIKNSIIISNGPIKFEC